MAVSTPPPPLAKENGAFNKLVELRRKSFRDQAIWFLNASEAGSDQTKCELVREIERKCDNLSADSNEKENVIDELMAHRLAEFSTKHYSQHLPGVDDNVVTGLREFMEETNNKSNTRRISLAELLIYQFGYKWKELVCSPESFDLLAEKKAREELDQAKNELNKLTEAAKKAAQFAEDARQSEKNALDEEENAAKAAEEANRAKLSASQLKEKASEALDALTMQEETTTQKREALEQIAADGKKGIVARNKATAELAILLSEDPLPLRTARIQQEAAMKKMTAAVKKSNEAAALAEATLDRATKARNNAIALRESALDAAKEPEESIPIAQNAFDKISDTLEDIMKKQKSGRGTIFFIRAELLEQKKFLPRSKFVVAQKRAEEAIKESTPMKKILL